MEVILNSEIARLVLGYLKDQSLDKAHRKFCQTSKYLKDEYVLLCRGYQPISVSNANLTEIIKEYCELKSKINQFINLFPNDILENIQSQLSLTKRLEFILSKAKTEILREGDANFKEHNSTKRKRSITITSSTSDTECTDHDNSFVNPAPYFRKNKMFKFHSPNIGYTILSSKDKIKNSTHRSGIKAETHAISPTADLTALKETLLENTEFQNKLADNINKILNCSAPVDKNDNNQEVNKDNGNPDQIQFAITNAIDNIISTIEQDPIFDHIVQDVVSHQTNLYDDEFELISSEQVEYNTNQEQSDRESPGISRTSTPKKDEGIINNTVIDITAADNDVNDEIQSKIIDKEVEIIPDRYDKMKNSFVISNEPFHAELLPNLQNLTTNTSHLIITPKSITTQAQQQNQSNLIFINDPTFNSALPVINLSNTSSNQFPFLMSSSMLNEPNVSFPFVMNSSPCVPISTAQFPVNFITQQQTIPSIPVPVRRGRPRKIMAPIQQQTAVTSTQTHRYQINQPIMEIISNSVTTNSLVNTNSVAVVSSSSNVLTIATSSQNTASNSVIYTQAASKAENQIISNESKIIADIQSSSSAVYPTTIVHSKIENLVKFPEVLESESPNNNEFIIIDVTDIAPKQSDNAETTEIEVITPQAEIKPIQFETTKIASSNEQEHSATPKQNMKPTENLKVKSNSTPRRKSHVRILDFTTPGRSEHIPQVPRTIERSIHLKSANWSKTSKFNKFEPKEKVEKNNVATQEGITATPKIKKNNRKCVRVLSRSASEEHYEKENENTDSNSEIKNVTNVTSDRISGVENVKLAVNLSPMDEWKQLRNISQTKNWDSYLRFVSAAEYVNKAKIKKSEEVAKRKLHKLKLMKERKQSKLAVKRLKKPVRKSPRLQKIRKGKILEKSKKLKRSLGDSKDVKDVEITTARVESNTELIKEEIIKKTDEVIGPVVSVIEDVSPVVTTSSNEFKEVMHLPHSMASLLETPFKSDIIEPNPKTPRFLPPLAVEDTPMTKILKSLNKHLGSELKSDIFTPNFAITPGCNLTPPKALDTPQSGPYNRPTDYSSGSSYYRPDESDDKIEPLTSSLRNKLSVNEFEYETTSAKITQTDNEQTIVVHCPGVLEKVKSFSENSNPIPESIVPHYTFNVPDESVENTEVETKDIDTSSSSSCSCSSSSSSSSSDSSNTSYHPKTESEPIANKIIDQKGEIRYPIRTWITPKKIEILDVSPQKNQPSTSTVFSDKQTVLRELEEKRIRMRDKIKISESSDSKINKSRQTTGNFKSKKNITPRQGVKQTIITSRSCNSSAAALAVDKIKPPRKNPTPKKLIPLKTNKSEPVAKPSNSGSFKEDINDLIAVLSDDRVKLRKQNLKMNDKVSIKSEDTELAEEFKDAYQNALSDSDDDDECEIVLQSEVLSYVYDEKLSCQTKENQNESAKDFLLSSRSVMNVNYDDRKIQIKASDLINLYEYTPRKHNVNKKPNLSRLKNIEYGEKSESKTFDSPNHKTKSKGKNDSQKKNTVRNDKKVINRQLHCNMPKEKNLKNVEPLIIPESPESTNTSTNQLAQAKAQFNLKYKKPKNHTLPVKKTILSRPFGSAIAPTTGAVQLSNTARKEVNQPFKIPINVDMKNKLKPSSSDTINAVLAHLHGTE